MSNKATNFDIILANYQDKLQDISDLPDKLQEEFNRWDYADNLIRHYHSMKDVVPMIMKKFNVSQATAYRDIANAKRFFASINKIDKDYWRYMLSEFCMDNLRLSIAKKDPKAVVLTIKTMYLVLGLDKDDPDMPNWEDIEQHNYNITLPKNLLDALTKLTKAGELNLSLLRPNLPISDIHHEEIQHGQSPGQPQHD